MIDLLDKFGRKIGKIEQFESLSFGFAFGLVGILFMIGVPIGFIIFIPTLIETIPNAANGDPIGIESLAMVISSFITWFVFLVKILLLKDSNEKSLPKKMFTLNYILLFVCVIVADLLFVKIKIVRFIIGLLISVITFAIWSFLASLLGSFIIVSIQRLISYFKKSK